MLLAADLGNTNITLGVFRERELLFSARLSSSRSRTADEYAVLLDALLRMRGVDPRDIHGAVLSSELKPLTPVFSAAVAQLCHTRPLIVWPQPSNVPAKKSPTYVAVLPTGVHVPVRAMSPAR